MFISDWLQQFIRPQVSMRRRGRARPFNTLTPVAEELELRRMLSAANDIISTTAILNASADAPGLLENDTGTGKQVTQYDHTSVNGAKVTVSSDGSYSYETQTNLESVYGLAVGQTLTDSFTYTITDSTGQSSTATVQVIIQGVNAAPHARDDEYSTDTLAPLIFDDPDAGVLVNDQSVDTTDSLGVVAIDEFSDLGAVISMNSDGTFTYTQTKQSRSALAAGEVEYDQFSYTIVDGSGLTDTAFVTIHIQVPNLEEVILTANEDQLLTQTNPYLFENLQNYNPQQPPTLVSSSSVSDLGVPVVVNADGSFSYDPRGIVSISSSTDGQYLEDAFTYVVNNQGDQIEVVARIIVAGAADGAQDVYTVLANTLFDSGAPGLLANDPVSSTILTTSVVSSLGITVTIRPDGSFIYDPTSDTGLVSLPAGATTYDFFDYQTQVGTDDPTTITVSVLIQGVDEPPTVLDDFLTTTSNVTLRVPGSTLLGNDDDVDVNRQIVLGRDIRVKTYAASSKFGARVVLGPTGDLIYDPQTSARLRGLQHDELEIDEFTYTLVDTSGQESTPATVYIQVLGDSAGPVATDDQFNIGEDGAESAFAFSADLSRHNVLANDGGGLGSLQVVRVDGVSDQGATVRISHGGDLAYDASTSTTLSALMTGELGEDSFTYTIADSLGHESTATVFIRFYGVNQGADDDFTAGTSSPLTVAAPGVLRNDPAGEEETVKVQGFDALSENGAAVTVNPDGSFTYDPRGVAAFADLNPGDILYDTFQYTTDPATGEQTFHAVTIAVSVTNQSPVLNLGAATVTLDSQGFLSVTGQITDPDSTNFSGEVTFGDGLPAAPLMITNGRFTIVHAYEKAGTYRVTVTLRDGDGAEVVKTISVSNPAQSATAAYVAQLYHAILGRDPSKSELTAGLVDKTLASRLVKNRDHQIQVINSVYETLLEREATPAEIQSHINALGSAELISGVVKAVALSNEFADLHSSPADRIQALFQGMVGRAPSSSESQALLGMLNLGKTLSDVLDAFVIGTPYLTAQTNAVYRQYVNTSAPAKDLAKLLKSLATHKTTFDAIAIKLVATTAFRARTHGPVASSISTPTPRDNDTFTPPTSSGALIESEDGYYSINFPADGNGLDYTGFEITTDPLTNEFIVLTEVSYAVKGLEDPVTQVFRDAFSATGVLGIVVGGSEGDDVIRVNTGKVHSGLLDPAFQDDQNVEFDALVTVYGLDGNDLIEVAGDRSLSSDYVPEIRLEGGDGNDTLLGGQFQNDILIGGNGDDYLDGFGGDDVLNGGFGVDTLVGGGQEDAASAQDDDLLITGGPISDGDILILDRGESTLTDEIFAGSPDLFYEGAEFGEAVRSVSRTDLPSTDLATLQRRLTPDEIRDDDVGGMDIQLNGNVLTISGVAGYGFQIVGNWQRSVPGQQPKSVAVPLDGPAALSQNSGTVVDRPGKVIPKPPTARNNANNVTTHSGTPESPPSIPSKPLPPGQIPVFQSTGRGMRRLMPQKAEEFSTKGGVFTLKSAMGDIPILLPPVRITTVPDWVDNYGRLDGNSIDIQTGFTFNSENFTEIREELSKVGMNFGGQNMGFGIGLGKYVKESVIRDAPLIDGVPYIYFNRLTNAPQVKQGGVTLQFGPDVGVGMVFDPADPFFYVTGKATIGSVSLGYSHRGQIEFEPESKGEFMKQVPVFGNIYAKGTVSLPTPVPGIEVGLEGTLVLDFDANNDGTTVFSSSSFNLDAFKRLLKGDKSVLVPFKDDLAIGVNGKGTINFAKGIASLEVPVGAGSLAYSAVAYNNKGLPVARKQVAFSGESIDPYKGTILERFSGQSKFSINGFADTDGFIAKMNGNFKLTPLSSANASLTVTNKSISFSGKAQTIIPLVPEATLQGRIGFDGVFTIEGLVRRNISFGPFGADMISRFLLSNATDPWGYYQGKPGNKKAITLTVDLYAGFKVDIKLVEFGGSLFGMATVDKDGNFSGTGRLNGYVDPLIGKKVDINIGFSFDRRGFTIGLPVVPDIKVRF